LLAQFLHWMGLGLCHQLPERSFFGGGVQVPVCARDTGIYVGFVVSMIVVSALHRGERPRGFPRTPVWVAMGAMLALMAWDGVTSYAGLRTTGNDLRLLSGLGVGFSAAAVLFPILNDELWTRASTVKVLDPTWRFFAWLASIPVCYAVTWWAGPLLGIAYPVLVAVCIVATLTAINLVIVAMLPRFDRRADNWAGVVTPTALAVAVSFVEIALAGQLRLLLEGLAR